MHFSLFLFAYVENFSYLCSAKVKMATKQFIEQIAALGKNILPKDASLWLYGSQARGEATPESDWDLLILLNKDKRELSDNAYAEQLSDYGFDHHQYVSPQIYTRKEWAAMNFMPFVKNVEHDKIVLV